MAEAHKIFHRGFTIAELLIVVVIIGILASVSIPAYTHTKESSLNNEAMKGVHMLWIAEHQAVLETDVPVISGDIAVLNANLSLDLSETNWDYAVVDLGGGDANITATRQGRTWWTRLSSPATNVVAYCAGC